MSNNFITRGKFGEFEQRESVAHKETIINFPTRCSSSVFFLRSFAVRQNVARGVAGGFVSAAYIIQRNFLVVAPGPELEALTRFRECNQFDPR